MYNYIECVCSSFTLYKVKPLTGRYAMFFSYCEFHSFCHSIKNKLKYRYYFLCIYSVYTFSPCNILYCNDYEIHVLKIIVCYACTAILI